MAKPPANSGPCSDTPQVLRFEAAPPLRPVLPCDPALPVPVPAYDYPEPQTVVPELERLPTPYIYLSPEVTVTCAEWPAMHSGEMVPEGAASTVSAGRFYQALALTAFGLSADALYHICRVVGSDPAPSRVLIDNADYRTLALLFHISETDARAITDRATAIQEELVATARGAAVDALDCAWWNTIQAIECVQDSGLMAALAGAYNPSVVEAHTFSSPDSQAEADALALATAESRLDCVWPCPAVTVYCSQDGFDGLDPGDPDLAGEGLLGIEGPGYNITPYPGATARWRVNYVTVSEADPAFDSRVSAEDAEALAQAWALAQLDCFYVNGQVEESCSGGSSETGGHVENLITYDGVSTGNPVTVPAGTAASFDSWWDAHNNAVLLAQGSLSCVYANAELVYSCDDSDSDTNVPAEVNAHTAGGVYDGDVPGQSWCALPNKTPIPVYVGQYGNTANIYALPLRSPGYHIRVAAGQFNGTTQAEADQLAALYALSQLQCTYCNPDLEPFCPSDSVSYTQEVPGVPYLGVDPHEVIDINGYLDPIVPLDDPTLGPAAPFPFCGADPYQVVATADLVGSIPVVNLVGPAPQCEYANAPVYAACDSEGLVGSPTTWEKQNFATREYATTPSIQRINNPAPACRLYNVANSTAGYVTVGYGEILADSQEAADLLAVGLALSKLTCVWGNPRITLLCGAASAYSGDGCEDELYGGNIGIDGGYYDSKTDWRSVESLESSVWDSTTGTWLHPTNDVDPRSRGSRFDPVIMPADSYFSQLSPFDAATTAWFIAYSQLDCFWTNDRTRAACPNGEGNATGLSATGEKYSAVYSFVVEGGTVPSYQSKDDANLMAQLIAESSLNCIYINDPQTGVDNCPFPCVAAKLYTVPAGIVTSSVSVADANRTALTLADALTQCYDLATLAQCDIPVTASSHHSTPSYNFSGGGGSGSGSGGSGAADCCAGIVVNHYAEVFTYGWSSCFNRTASPQWVVIKVEVSITQPDGCRRACKQWGARVTIPFASGSVFGSGWSTSTMNMGLPFPLGLDGEGNSGVFLFKVDPVSPCSELDMYVDVYQDGARLTGDDCSKGTCPFHYMIPLPAYCDGGCDSSSPSSSPNSSSPAHSPAHSTSASPHSHSPSHHSSPAHSPGASPTSSSKNAIVPASWAKTGYAAWFIAETPEVLFFEFPELKLTGRETVIPIDFRVLEGCEPASLKVCGVPDGRVRAEVLGKNIVATVWAADAGETPESITVMLVGTRRGFADLRLPEKTRLEFEANERRLNPL